MYIEDFIDWANTKLADSGFIVDSAHQNVFVFSVLYPDKSVLELQIPLTAFEADEMTAEQLASQFAERVKERYELEML